jgi:sulfite exporter TauE/SafE
MGIGSLTFGGGLALGLASSLHCAGMCGPIASSLMFAFAPERGRALMAAQAGRILVYIAAGAAVGAAGAAFYGAFNHPAAFLVMRAAAALSLGWIGFSLLGLAPSLAGLDRLTQPIARAVAAIRAPGGFGAFGAGMVWGFLPCGMVFGALFYAALSGGAASGALVMTGFGLGTLPSVTSAALGVAKFRDLAHGPVLRVAVGLGMMGIAAASLALPAAVGAVFCLP